MTVQLRRAVSKGLDSDPGFRYRDGVFAALRSPVHTGMAIVAMGRPSGGCWAGRIPERADGMTIEILLCRNTD